VRVLREQHTRKIPQIQYGITSWYHELGLGLPPVAARELGGEPGRPARARARSAVADPGAGRALASGAGVVRGRRWKKGSLAGHARPTARASASSRRRGEQAASAGPAARAERELAAERLEVRASD